MHSTNRRISTFGAVVVFVASLAACGTGDSSGETVARVAGVGTISKATLEHWIPIEAVVIYREHPTAPVPKGIIPDPPSYAACKAFLKTTPQKLVETGPKPSASELRRKCAHRYRELREITLNTLISWNWTLGAGLELGIHVSDAEVKRWFDRVTKSENPGKGEFANYREATRQTIPDILFRSKVQLVEVKLIARRTALAKRVPKGLSPQQQEETAFAKFIRAMPPSKRWARKTTCRKGYVVSACRQYRGPEAPGFPN